MSLQIQHFPQGKSFEENVVALAEHWNDTTEPGHGQFFDFLNFPELEKPVLAYLSDIYGWVLERHDFIRKPDEKALKVQGCVYFVNGDKL